MPWVSSSHGQKLIITNLKEKKMDNIIGFMADAFSFDEFVVAEAEDDD